MILKNFKSDKSRTDGESTETSKDDTESPNTKQEMVRLANKNPEPKSLLSNKFSKNIFASPTSFLGGSGVQKEEIKITSRNKDDIEFEGEMMRKASKDKFKKYYYRLLDKELYVYKTKKDEEHKTMINLIGVFLRTDSEEPLDKKNILYPFTLIFPNKERTFYLLSKSAREKWVSKIK